MKRFLPTILRWKLLLRVMVSAAVLVLAFALSACGGDEGTGISGDATAMVVVGNKTLTFKNGECSKGFGDDPSFAVNIGHGDNYFGLSVGPGGTRSGNGGWEFTGDAVSAIVGKQGGTSFISGNGARVTVDADFKAGDFEETYGGYSGSFQCEKSGPREREATPAATKTVEAGETPKATENPSGGGEANLRDVPIYPGAKKVRQGSRNLPVPFAAGEGPEVGEFTDIEWTWYNTGDAMDKVTEFYKSQMPDNGWDEQGWSETSSGGIAWGTYTRDDGDAVAWVFALALAGENTQIIIATGLP